MENDTQSDFKYKRLYVIGLLTILYFMYSSTFLTDYLMIDEKAIIGEFKPETAREAMSSYFFILGRGLLGLYMKWVYDFAGYDTSHIQFVRFANFLSIAIISILLMNFLAEQVKSYWTAFVVILFYLSQISFQGLMGYSLQLISSSQPAMWLSLLAFYLFFYLFDKWRFSIYLQALFVFALLMLAMQSTQVYTYFALIPMSYLALAEWKDRKSKVLQFLVISFATLILSTLIYKLGLNYLSKQGEAGYVLGERGVRYLIEEPMSVILLAVNPLAYWSAFKMWTFPFPLQNIPSLRNLIERLASLFLMAVWFGIIFTAFRIEIKNITKNERLEILLKWFAIVCCFVLAAVMIVADSPMKIIDHRPHLLLVFSGLVVFTGVYALKILLARFAFLRNRKLKVFVSIIVLFIAFGAQAGVLRNIVNVQMKQLDFIRIQLLAKNPEDYKEVIVIMPSQDRGCITEPCDHWFGVYIDSNWHLARPGAYRYALSTLGVNPTEKELIFLNSSKDIITQNEAIIIDWNVFSVTQQMYAEYFRGMYNFGILEKFIFNLSNEK